jgi:hypothetical protein
MELTNGLEAREEGVSGWIRSHGVVVPEKSLGCGCHVPLDDLGWGVRVMGVKEDVFDVRHAEDCHEAVGGAECDAKTIGSSKGLALSS